MTLTKEKRALWRVHALAKGSFNRFDVLSLLDELDAKEAELRDKMSFAYEVGRSDGEDAVRNPHHSAKTNPYRKGSTP